MKILVLKPLENEDIPKLKQWLYKEHVHKWYEHPEHWLHEVTNRHREFSFAHHFIVLADALPIGFCQYYDCFDAAEDWYKVEEKGNVFSIDYLIGETKYLRMGLGREIVLKVESLIKENTHAEMIIVKPESENTASNKTLISCGFYYDKDKDYYLKKLVT